VTDIGSKSASRFSCGVIADPECQWSVHKIDKLKLALLLLQWG
jgi:hypothetical protein